MSNGKKIFKAKYQKTTDKIVHGVEMKENDARFFITKVLKSASSWKDFDVDKHAAGGAILWSTKAIIKMRLGSCEVASCLWKYLEIKSSEGYKKVIFWQIGCSGQNCNRMILNMLISEALEIFQFNSISLE